MKRKVLASSQKNGLKFFNHELKYKQDADTCLLIVGCVDVNKPYLYSLFLYVNFTSSNLSETTLTNQKFV